MIKLLIHKQAFYIRFKLLTLTHHLYPWALTNMAHGANLDIHNYQHVNIYHDIFDFIFNLTLVKPGPYNSVYKPEI